MASGTILPGQDIETGKYTFNTDYVSSSTINRYYKIGHIVFVPFNFKIETAQAGVILMQGLPAPMVQIAFTVSHAQPRIAACILKTNGNIVTDAAPSSVGWYDGCLVYFSAK